MEILGRERRRRWSNAEKLEIVAAVGMNGEWNRIFPDPAMTLAAVDRLVHHATIFEMNVESYRRRAAIQRQSKAGRPPTSHPDRRAIDIGPTRDAVGNPSIEVGPSMLASFTSTDSESDGVVAALPRRHRNVPKKWC